MFFLEPLMQFVFRLIRKLKRKIRYCTGRRLYDKDELSTILEADFVDKPPEEVKWNTFGYGLYLHFLFQGFVLKTLFSIIYPFYANYLNLDGHQYRAASTLPLAAWSLKTIIGVVSDVWPISGQRRRPYMILGMGLSFIPLAIITFKPVPKPYYEPVYANGTCFLNKETVYNADAKQEGIQYVVINTLAFMLLSFADVAADGLKVRCWIIFGVNILLPTDRSHIFTRNAKIFV